MTKVSTGKSERLAVAELRLFEGNPRRGNVDMIAESLLATGQYKPLVVNVGTHTGREREVLAGNHTLLAAQKLGWEQVDVWMVDVDDATARRIVAADNRLADLGEYDDAELFALLESLDGDLVGTGYDDEFFTGLSRELFPPQTNTDPDDVPPLPVEAVSKVGQIWLLGDHRLLVGDATDLPAVERLVGNTAPDCIWTDPPYGVDYVGGNHMLSPAERRKRGGKTMDNDASAIGLPELLRDAFGVMMKVCRAGAPVYVMHADTERPMVEAAMRDSGLLVRQSMVWVKSSIVMGRSDYHYRHEPILYGFTPKGKGRLGRGSANWHGDNTADTVFEFDRPARSEEHPTMKPAGLIDAMLANSCPPGGVVFDPFVGSGSTLIAAHGRGMRCLAVELDPRYADVVVRRFEEHTGIGAQLADQ